MAEQLQWIRAFVDRLVRREQALITLRIAASLALLLLVGLGLAAALTALRADRAWATVVLVVTLGVGGWFAVGWPLVTRWLASTDVQRQARLVEAQHPDFRGRLVTALDLDDAASTPMAELLVRRAHARLAELSVADLLPADRTLRAVQVVALCWLVGLPSLWYGTRGFSTLTDYWLAPNAAGAAVAAIDVAPPDEVARVGDIVIRYTYPDYTGLDTKTVSNSTGDVQGPPGTNVEVSARSAKRVEAAGLIAYEEALEAQVLEEGRVVTGQFSILAESGAYRLQLYREGEPEPSREFAIEVEPDLPPEVMLDSQGRDVIEVAVDESFPVRWQARDDYGIQRVALLLRGQPTERALARPERRVADVGRTQSFRPRELGLKAGDRVPLAVIAWDNDTVSGSKSGTSRSIELVVLGPNGIGVRAAERREELKELMIPLLADFLVEPWPMQGKAGLFADWGETVAKRYEPFVARVEALFGGLSRRSQDRAIAERVVETGRDLVRFTQVSFEPGSTSTLRPDDAATLDELRDDAIVALEEGILAFHRMQRNLALAELVQQAQQLRNLAEQMESTLDKAEPEAMELLSQLDALQRMMQELAQRASQLDESGLREFLNSRESEASSLMEEIRQAIADGNLEEARELMRRLSELVDEMGRGIQEEMERRLQQGQQQQDQAGELQAELEDIKQTQEQLQAEVQQLRQQDQGPDERTESLWAELAKRAQEHRTSSQAYLEGLRNADRAFFEQERARAGVEEARDLSVAIEARDIRGARNAIGAGSTAWATSLRAIQLELSRSGSLDGPGRDDVLALLDQLVAIEKLLDQLEQAEPQASPESRQQAQELEDRQRDLDNRLEQARQQAQELERQFPVRPQGMREALEEAGERMDDASDNLGEGELMQAEGSQGVASQRIQDAIESLQQARQSARGQSQPLQSGGEPQPGQEREGEGDEDGEQSGDGISRGEFEIPGREEFRTPEAYRQALLEGMQGDVPEEYRAMKRRYYEELVHQ